MSQRWSVCTAAADSFTDPKSVTVYAQNLGHWHILTAYAKFKVRRHLPVISSLIVTGGYLSANGDGYLIHHFNFYNFRRQYKRSRLCYRVAPVCRLSVMYRVSQKIPPAVFRQFFPNGWEFFNHCLHTYYTFLSTLHYKFLFNYLQFWRSYTILSATTQRIFTFHLKFNF